MKTSRAFGLLSSGVFVVGTSLLAAGCSAPDDIEAGGSRQNLAAKDVKTLFACEQLTGDGKGLSVGWSKKDKAITYRDSVYDLESVDFYPDNVSPNSGGPGGWRLELGMSDRESPKAEGAELQFWISMDEVEPRMTIHYGDLINRKYFTGTGNDCRRGHSMSLATLTEFLQANADIYEDRDKKWLTPETATFGEGKIWDCWDSPPFDMEKLVGFYGNSLVFPADPGAPGVEKDDRSGLYSAPVAKAHLDDDGSGNATFKFVSVLSDRRYFGQINVTKNGARKSEFLLYEGPLAGGGADAELAAHSNDKLTRRTCDISNFVFERRMARAVITNIGQ